MPNLMPSLRRALHLAPEFTDTGQHFHIGSDGRPFVCDLHRCESPGLSAAEVGAAG